MYLKGIIIVVTDHDCMTTGHSTVAESQPPLLHWGGEGVIETSKQTNKQTNEQTNEWARKRTSEQGNEQVNEQVNKWANKRANKKFKLVYVFKGIILMVTVFELVRSNGDCI